jgi:hypothetical protein
MICCDSCPRVFHKQCLKLKRVPEGHWICPICKSTNAAKCSLCNQNLSKHTSPYKLICSKCRCLMHYDCVEVPIFLLFKTCKYIQQDTTKITNSQVDVLIDYVCFDCQKNLGIQKICDVYNYQQNSPSAQPLTHNNYYFIKFESKLKIINLTLSFRFVLFALCLGLLRFCQGVQSQEAKEL